MSTRLTQAFVQEESGDGRLLKRLSSERCPFANETDLQELLRRQPGLLGAEQIDPMYAPPVCIAREASMSGNNIDNLYISPEGYVTIVEAKLWKNQELRRKVLAQIIEYASNLSKRKYADLEEMFSRFVRKYHPDRVGTPLHAWVAEGSGRTVDEHEFRRSASRCLADGEFLLLIIAERIAESTEDLIEFVNSTPGLAYSLHLVELCCFPLGQADRPMIIVPRIAARMTAVERAVVRVVRDDNAIDIRVEAPSVPTLPAASRERQREAVAKSAAPLLEPNAIASQFFQSLAAGGITSSPKGARSSYLAFPSITGGEIKGFWLENNESLYVYGELREQLQNAGFPRELASDLWTSLHAIDPAFPPPEYFSNQQYKKGGKLSELVANGKLDAVVKALVGFANILRAGSK
jgi:hypothetical protein